jgi:uncharacterized membrane protein HdeD (DUF308 family)
MLDPTTAREQNMASRLRHQFAGADHGAFGHGWTFRAWVTPDQIDRARRWLMVAGSLSLIIGVVSIALPVIASVTTAIFVGWVLIASGIAVAIHAISHRAPVRGLEALIALVAGFYLLVFPLKGTVTLTFVLAMWFFASGILSVIYGPQWSGVPGGWIHTLGGVLSVILGFLIAASLPSSATWVVGLLVGINLIFWGVRAMIGARLLKGLAGSAGGRRGGRSTV